MICQLCNKNEATIHLTEIVDSAKIEVHVCEPCAKEQNIATNDAYTIPELMLDSKPNTKDEVELVCDKCGWSFEDLKREGKFGCPNDYNVFSSEVSSLLQRIHHSTKHVGKNPNIKTQARISDLEIIRHQLEQAVASERFEEAAILRDKLRAL